MHKLYTFLKQLLTKANTRHPFLVCFLFLIICQTSALAQKPNSGSNQVQLIKEQLVHPQDSIRLQAMLNMAYYYENNQPDSAKLWSDKALSLAFKLGQKPAIAQSYFHLATYFNNSGNLNEATRYYFKSLEIFERIQSSPELITIYNHIGNLYFQQNQNKKALEFYKKSLSLNNHLNSPNLALSLKCIGDIQFKNGKLNKAQEYYLRAKEEFIKHKDENGLGNILLCIGLIEARKDNSNKAIKFFSKALEKFTIQNNSLGMINSQANMGKCYTKLNRWVSANNSFNKAMNLAKILDHLEWQMKINLYKAELYSQKGDHKSALGFYKIHYALNDSIFSLKNSQQLAQWEAKYETEQKNRKIEQLKEQERIIKLKWYALSTGTILIILFTSILIYKQQKQIKRDKEIIKKNKEIHTAQQALLAAKLEYKGNELQNFAIHIIQKNDFLQSIKESLGKINRFANEENRDLVKKINLQIQQNLQLGKDIEVFHKKISRMNEDFFQKLEARFPNLTDKEKKLCALLKLNFSSKEIASLNNISERAVVMARYRLRKKIQLPAEDKLSDFLNKVK